MAQELKAHFPYIMIKDSCKYMLPSTYEGAYPVTLPSILVEQLTAVHQLYKNGL
ncbi:MAG: hypothetical protein M3512_05430 [Bacteroidota bacterium]|nr:hypothetical protein [Bacteroidota bacterium]